MRYANGSNGNYGKVNFICDTSKYEVVKVERYFSNTSSSNYGSADKVYEGTIPSDLSVQFTSNNSYYYYTPTHEHYKFIAYVQAKTIHVKYDANSGTGAPKGTTVKSTEKVTVDSTTRPTREGYIFTGWAYGGRLYQGGESFDAPISDVTFVAQWAKASDVINYTVNDSKMGSVSRSYERIGETVQGNVQGSTAIAETGYRFVKWVKGTDPKADAVSTDVEYKPTTKGTYMAVFEAVTSDLVIRYVDTDGKDISDSETKSYKYGESYTVKAKDIKGYRLKSESPITGTKGVAREEVTFTYTKKKGTVVYNLGPNGSWGNGSPDNVVVFDAAKGKWAYNYGFDKGDKFVVTKSVPTSSDNVVFVGWYDKKRDNTPATMRKAGDTVTYPYTEASDTNTYTLDALWEKLQGADKELPYDGKEHSLDEFTVKFANDNLQGWTDSASSLVQASNIQYRLKQDGKNEWGAMPIFKDAGTYTIEAKATVNGVELKAEATLTINPATVTLKSADLDKEYDGKALVNGEKALATEEGWAEGEGATYNFTGSQTVVGSSANAFTYTLNEGTNADNYTINKTEGKLTVKDRETKYEITVKAKDGTATYDGKDHTVSGFEVTTFEVNGNKYTVTGLSASVTGKAAGKYTSKVTGKAVVKDAAGNNVTKQFTVNTENGSLVISKATVTLKSADLDKEYDGKALVNGEKALATEEGWAEGEGATYNFTGSQTVVGSSANAFTYTLNEGTNADNYTINKTEGKLTVKDRETKYEITVKAKDGTATYDGKDHTVSGFEVTTFEVNGNKYTVTGLSASVTGKAAGKYTSKVTGKAVVKDAAGNNVTKQFTVNTENGSLVINRKKYTVETLDGNKTYDGIPLTAGAKINGIIEGEVVEIKTTKSLTDVGSIPNDKYELTWKTAKATNYKLDGEKFGTLTVTAQSIDPGTDPEKPNPDYTGAKVNSPSDEVYDGNEHKWIPTVTDKADKKLKAGTDYTVEYSTKNFKDVGTIDVTITGIGNYTGTVTRTYKITPKSVTVTAEDKTKVFGETDPKLTAAVAGTLGNDTVKYTLSREDGEAVGKYTITASGKAEQGNYSVTYAAGTLTITNQSIDPGTDPEKPNPDYTGAKVNSPSDEVYDGNEHKWIPTVTDKADKKLKADTDYTVEYSTSDFTNVGTIKVTITGIGNYTGTVTRTYKITPKSVTVTAEDKTKVFGETDPKLTATVAGTLGNDTVEYKLSREAGEAAGKYEITVKGDKLQGNYTVTYATGTLTITSQSIDPGTDSEKPNPDYTGAKVNSPSDKVYDGNEHKWIPTVTDKADKKLKAGTDYKVEYSTSDFTNVGTVEVTITGKGNYTGTVKRSYKVTPKEYTVTTDSATKTYSGTALTAGGKVEGIVSGETVEFTTTGSQTEVGTSKNTYELVWKSAKATNYALAKESIGKLTVKAKSIVPDGPDTPDEKKTGITVSEPSDSKYDGKVHREVLTVTDTKTGKELVAGTDYSVTYSSDLVNAGTVKVTVAGLGNYSGSFTKTYKITKRSVTLTSATVSKVYDGSALTNTSITVSGDGFVEGEGASYEVTGTQTEVGNSANAFEYKLNEKTLASNYNITKVVGTLTITAAPAPVTPATPSTPSTPSSTTSTTPRTPSAPQVTTPVETVEKETTPKTEPKKEEKVEEEYTPKASPQYYWALINLICAILTVLFGLLLLISKRHKDEDDDEEDDETKQQTNNDDEEKEQEKKRGLFTRVLAVLIAIVSVVFFLLTEDLSLPWTWTDQWTIWMVVIGLVQIVVFFVGRKWKNVDDDEDEEEAQQA